MKQLQNTMYTITRHSNASNVMRWAMPFWGAWGNAMKTYARLIWENPDRAARMALLWEAPNYAGMVVDGNGNPVPVDGMNDTSRVQIQVPDWMHRYLPL